MLNIHIIYMCITITYIYVCIYIIICVIYTVCIYIHTSPHSAMAILPGNSRAMLHALITVFTFITDTLDVGNVPSAEQPAIQWLSQLSQGSATQSV